MFRQPCFALIVTALAFVAPVQAAQDPPIESVFRNGVEVVRGRITQSGRGNKRLVKEDFEITQNGVVQEIDVFEMFVLSPTRTCYEIGFSSTTPAAVKTRTVEIKIRGYAKRIKSTYTITESPPDAKPRASGGCKAPAGIPS